MNRKELFGSVLLLLCAMIWGSAFVAQRSGLDYMGPCFFNALRSIIGAMALVPCIALLDRLQGHRVSLWGGLTGHDRAVLLAGGLSCGLVLGCASLLQQLGLAHTSVGKAGFITTLYVVIVPLLGLFVGRRVGLRLWIGVALAVFGMYLLCYKGGEPVNRGDLLVFFCSILFSLHIIVIDYFAPRTDCVRMSCLQFLVCGVMSLAIALCVETLTFRSVLNGYVPLLYAGVLSSAVAFTLQILAQKNVHPVVASLLMSLESVFAALGGWVVLNEQLSLREACGCCVIFAAVILAQLRSQKTPPAKATLPPQQESFAPRP